MAHFFATLILPRKGYNMGCSLDMEHLVFIVCFVLLVHSLSGAQRFNFPYLEAPFTSNVFEEEESYAQ